MFIIEYLKYANIAIPQNLNLKKVIKKYRILKKADKI